MISCPYFNIYRPWLDVHPVACSHDTGGSPVQVSYSMVSVLAEVEHPICFGAPVLGSWWKEGYLLDPAGLSWVHLSPLQSLQHIGFSRAALAALEVS